MHVYHALIGEHTTVQFPPNNPLQTSNLYEEARTVGLGSFKNEPIFENKYREEAHLPRRAMYETPNGIYTRQRYFLSEIWKMEREFYYSVSTLTMQMIKPPTQHTKHFKMYSTAISSNKRPPL